LRRKRTKQAAAKSFMVSMVVEGARRTMKELARGLLLCCVLSSEATPLYL